MTALEQVFDELTESQRDAVRIDDGAALILAGPGAGKTMLLTTRIARLLNQNPEKNYRILALTFTNKAADEMKARVETLVPELVHRTFIGTFHALAADVLRQHGSHIGIKPDFRIFAEDSDRLALFSDAVSTRGLDKGFATNIVSTIDRLKQSLIIPKHTASRFGDSDVGEKIAKYYEVYEAALANENCIDFNGLILEMARLVTTKKPIAARLRVTYPYWLIDEFQDTSPAQYRMLRAWSGGEFKNIFAVADDDQIIYQWAGASYKQLERFRTHFEPVEIQLVENHRCPPNVVHAANALVSNNAMRTPDKKPLVATRADTENTIECSNHTDEDSEALYVATQILNLGQQCWPSTAVIARSRTQLEKLKIELSNLGVDASLAERRSRFITPQLVSLQCCIELAAHPAARRTAQLLIAALNRLEGSASISEAALEEAEALETSYLEQIGSCLSYAEEPMSIYSTLADALINNRKAWRAAISECVRSLQETISHEEPDCDLVEDLAAWNALQSEILRELGPSPSIASFIQALALRSKSPPLDPNTVSLLTIHSSKGLEFDFVFIIGMAEEILPTYQSLKKGDHSRELEEERRNCFVAVTRTKNSLFLSWPESHRGYRKRASRFLNEMGLA